MANCAIIIVTKNRFNLTKQCLLSLLLSDQPIKDYDIYVIDNGSDETELQKLKQFTKSQQIAKLYVLDSPMPISVAYNLGLLLTQDYKYRIKLDNDMIVPGFLSTQYKPITTNYFNPGAIQTNNYIFGGTSVIKTKNRKIKHSRFIDHLKVILNKSKAGLSALVPIPLNYDLNSALDLYYDKKLKNKSYLSGACLMIPKSTFKEYGFFNEKLLRKIDIEYTQRVMQSGVTALYSENFGLIHLGEYNPADPEHEEKYNSLSISMLYNNSFPKYQDSCWLPYFDDIKKLSKNNTIVKLSGCKEIYDEAKFVINNYSGRPIQMNASLE